ncbi:MAG: efflux RND transporter periplasmic adaptor subunit [Dehalococcoidia bacterium]
MKFLAALVRGVFTLAVLAALGGLFAYAKNDWKAPWAEPPAHGEDWCQAHGVALSECEQCNIELQRGGTFSVAAREPEEGECPNCLVRITLAKGAAEEIGLESTPVKSQAVSERLEANAETMYAPAAHARVAPLIAGIVREVPIQLGQEVEAGAVLAVIESTQMGQAKAQYLNRMDLLALRQERHAQERDLFEKKLSLRSKLLDAEVLVSEAQLEVQECAQRLAGLGLPSGAIAQLVRTKDTSPMVEVVAPFDGMVTEVSTVIGERASPERPLVAIADMGRMWVAIDIYEQDLARVEIGQRAYFRLPALPSRRFGGKIVASAGAVDEHTRTIRFFADVKNREGLLRAHMFGRATIVIKPAEPRLLIPKAALQDDGDCKLVFIQLKDNVFHSRGIEVGAVFENGYEVTAGLQEGERVVTTGSFLLKTEILRGQIGAG